MGIFFFYKNNRQLEKQAKKQTNKKQTHKKEEGGGSKERTGKEKSNTRRSQGRIRSACSTNESLFTGPKSHSYQPQNSVAFSQDTVPTPPFGGERWHSFQKMNILRWLVFIFAKQVRGWYVMESYVTSWLQCWCCSYYPDVLVYSPRKLAKSFLCCLSCAALKGTSFWNVVWPSDVWLASGKIWSVEELGGARRRPHHSIDRLEKRGIEGSSLIGPSSTLEPFQRRLWGNFSETGWSAYGLFQVHRYDLNLKRTEVFCPNGQNNSNWKLHIKGFGFCCCFIFYFCHVVVATPDRMWYLWAGRACTQKRAT